MRGQRKHISRRRFFAFWMVLLFAVSSASAGTQSSPRFHTRSIVACDPVENACGIAVVSFLSGVPAVVPVGQPGIMVANQGLLPSFDTAKRIIENVTSGMNAPEALAQALMMDPLAESRQFGVASLDPSLRSGVSVTSFSGSFTTLELPETCNVTGRTFAIQAGSQTSAKVCAAMAKVFKRTRGSLAVRLMKALLAGAKVGTDARGEFSASVKVYAQEWELASITPLSADANVNRAANWEEELEFGVHGFLASLTPADIRNRVKLTRKRARKILRALKKLGYYDGPVRGIWSPEAEQALLSFGALNLVFPSGTFVDSGIRFIDGPLAAYIPEGEKRSVVVPAPRLE